MITKRNKSLFFSVLLILVWFTFLIKGSYALYSDQAILIGNTISSGTFDLQINSSQQSLAGNFTEVQPGFDMNLIPGTNSSRYLFLRNTGTALVDMDIHAKALTFPIHDSIAFSKVKIGFMPVTANAEPMGVETKISLEDLVLNVKPINSVINAGQIQRYLITTYMEPEFEAQYMTMEYDLQFVGIQHVLP